MNKIINFCSLCLFVCQLGLSQTDTILLLPDVKIGDQRISIPFSNSTRTISILTKKEITQLSAQSLNETLGYFGGVDVKTRGVKGSQADLSIRGSTFEQVLVMINGIKMNDPQTGHHSLNIPIPFESIERIEVLKGPGARRFGQNAFAGAINLITKVPERDVVNAGLEVGSYGGVNASLGAALNHGDFSQMLQLGYITSDGYRHNTDFNIGNFFYQNNWKIGKGTWSSFAGFSKRKFGANGFYASPTFTDQYEEVETSIVSVDYKWIGNSFHIKPSIHWRRNQDEYLLVRDNPEVYRNLHFGNSIGMEVQSGLYSDLGLTGIGVEWRRIYLKSNNLGNHVRDELSLFLEHRFEFWDNKFSITPGVSVNYFSDFGEFFYPGIDAGYSFSKKWKVYGNIGDTYRIPTFTDLFYIGPSNVGNKDLKPEKATSYELGVKHFGDQWYWNVALFQRNSHDLIDWVKDLEEEPWMPRNHYEAVFNGIELDQKWTLGTPGAKVEMIGLSYNYIHSELKGEASSSLSRYALDNLKHQVILRTSGTIWSKWKYSLGLRYLDRVNLENYALGDIKIHYAALQGTWSAQINNVFNTDYTETSLIPMPGRTFNVGFKRNFYLN